MDNKRFLILGAGQMGRALAFDLVRSRGNEYVTVLDSNNESCESLNAWLDINVMNLDVKDEVKLQEYISSADIVIAALPYRFNLSLMKKAIKAGCNFCDLGGNDPIVSQQLALDPDAKAAGVLCVPDCGLAPGMANVLAAHLTSEYDRVETLTIRVGGLPQHPEPPLNYQLVFSVGGLVNEYVEKCKILREGIITYTEPMTGLESIHFEGLGELEAFNTSGGAAWLPELFHGKVSKLDYKTIRYPGHCDIMKDILDSGLAQREVLEKQLISMLAGDDVDLVLVKICVEGEIMGEKKGISLEIMDYYDKENDITAMMRCTSYPTSIIAQLIVDSKIPENGVRTPEMCVPGEEFLMGLTQRGINVKKKVIDA
jgi:lysine 6-dehydrogenase